MKRFLIVMAALSVIGIMQTSEHTYHRDGTIISISSNIVAIEDDSGNVWEYYSQSNEKVGERVEMRMHDNMTDSIIKDDRVIGIKKI